MQKKVVSLLDSSVENNEKLICSDSYFDKINFNFHFFFFGDASSFLRFVYAVQLFLNRKMWARFIDSLVVVNLDFFFDYDLKKNAFSQTLNDKNHIHETTIHFSWYIFILVLRFFKSFFDFSCLTTESLNWKHLNSFEKKT